jgi:hypothetical protein
MSLLLHCGAEHVSEEELRQIPVPPATKTWYPLGHAHVLDAVRDTLTDAGYEIRQQALSVTREGQRFFGTLDLTTPILEGVTLAVGIRNSVDKSFPIGFAVGSRVFVCDNLSFESEIVVNRKHTRFGEERFMEGIATGVNLLNDHRVQQAQWFQDLRVRRLDTNEPEALILRAYEQDLIGARHLPLVLNEWRRPTFDHGGETAWALWNTFTHVLGADMYKNPAKAAIRTIRLQGIFRPEVIDGEVVQAA